MNQEFEFKEEQVPYDLLGQYGLTREMIEDLPEAPYRDIMNGLLSPVLPVSVRDEAGNTISARTRIRLVGTDDGKVDVLFYPRLLRCELDSYSEAEQYELRQGRVILSHAPDDADRKCFVQIDPDTNQVMYVPTPVIGRNIRNLMDRFELSTDDITLIQMGEAAVVGTGKDVLSIGIDLSERTGIRMERGKSFKWNRDRGSGMDRFSFGIYGCWVKDANGDLSYVPEEEYSDEIIAEQQKHIDRNAANLNDNGHGREHELHRRPAGADGPGRRDLPC